MGYHDYRAYIYERSEMVEVQGINFTSEGIWTNKLFDDEDAADFIFFTDCKLMRSTGIKDKNDKEIYEGDILHWIDNSKAGDGTLEDNVIVYWDNEFLAWTVQGNNWSEDEPPHYLFECKNPGEIEVIGNIYEGLTRNEAI